MLLENKCILMFEDNIENIKVQKMMLEDEGAKIILFTGGRLQEIVEMLPIDLIIMDLMIPGSMDGFDYYQKIQEIPELADIPVVAVSAMDASLAISKAQEIGFSGFVAKPVDMDIFPRQIVSIMDGKPIWNTR